MEPRLLTRVGQHLPRKPCSRLSCSKRSSQAQTRGAHREIADQIPKQGSKLNQRRDKGEDSAMDLCYVSIPFSSSSSLLLVGVLTYLDSKHEGHCYGSKVGGGKR